MAKSRRGPSQIARHPTRRPLLEPKSEEEVRAGRERAEARLNEARTRPVMQRGLAGHLVHSQVLTPLEIVSNFAGYELPPSLVTELRGDARRLAVGEQAYVGLLLRAKARLLISRRRNGTR